MTQPPYGSEPYSSNPYGQPNPYEQPSPYGQQPNTAYGQPALPAMPAPSSAPPGSGPPYSQTYQLPISGAPTSGGYDPYGQPAYGQPAYGQPPYGQPAYGQPAYGAPVAVGYDPVTGQPYSDKSKLVAGLLQLLPSVFFALGGIGRLYAGNVALGITQLILSVIIGWAGFVCGFFLLFVPWLVTGGLWLWFIIDGIMILAGRPVDGQGRPLRPN